MAKAYFSLILYVHCRLAGPLLGVISTPGQKLTAVALSLFVAFVVTMSEGKRAVVNCAQALKASAHYFGEKKSHGDI